MTSNMSLSGDLGISPVLLQAISLKSSEGLAERLALKREAPTTTLTLTPTLASMEKKAPPPPPSSQPHPLPMQAQSSKVVTHLLQGMNEPVSALLSAQLAETTSTTTTLTSRGEKSLGSGGVGRQEVLLNTSVQERLATQIAIKQGRVVTTTMGGGTGDSNPGNVCMVNVLTALASQHRRHASVKREEEVGGQGQGKGRGGEGSDTFTTSILPTTAAAATTPTPTTTADVVVRAGGGEVGDERSQPQIIIYYNNGSSPVPVPSPANDVVVVGGGEVGVGDGGGGERSSVHNYRLVMHHREVVVSGAPTVTTLSTDPSVQMITEAAHATAAMASETSGTFVATDSNSSEALSGDCPVCGDKLSGYHYGVFTCESCKGFFKRTVQNKKTFMCHKQSSCEVNLFNRKKCPACRFAKCMQAGMKLEAIRQDRTRGGRSSYEGCSPHNRPRPSPLPRKAKRPSSISREDSSSSGAGGGGGVMTEVGVGPKEEGKSHRQLVAILNHSNPHGQQVSDGQGKQVPELLTDIMNLEALLTDDDLPQDGGGEGEGDQAFYHYLMQLTELRLYKLVRWARNLPQFGAISTDDQILLLQNCWSDLLALGVCWRSVASPGVLSISAMRSIAPEQAEALGFGDVVSRLLSITQSLRKLRVDEYEYVALKVLLLITPDVKGLKEPSKIQEYQDKLSEALMDYTASHCPQAMMDYTASHCPQAPTKFGEMLLRLPELARVSFLAKEILLLALPPPPPPLAASWWSCSRGRML